MRRRRRRIGALEAFETTLYAYWDALTVGILDDKERSKIFYSQHYSTNLVF